MLKIAIDGACRRNGKPDCVSAGGVFIEHYNEELILTHTEVKSNYEYKSTNQRGELLALLTALDYIYSAKQDCLLITDSEYLFNAVTKGWITNWDKTGWVTSTGTQVKNKDLFQQILHASRRCEAVNIEITYYHIKGHCVPFGKVTANTLLLMDTHGGTLRNKVLEKYENIYVHTKQESLAEANVLSLKNNGFEFDDNTLKDFIVMNIVADSVATVCVDAADQLYLK